MFTFKIVLFYYSAFEYVCLFLIIYYFIFVM